MKRFLPLDTRISVRPEGIETMVAGYQFRFGADTKFTLENGTIYLHEGSLMIQSRNIGNQVVLKSPEAVVNILELTGRWKLKLMVGSN